MLPYACACGWEWSDRTSADPAAVRCPQCSRMLRALAGYDTAFVEIAAGPARMGERIFLGGASDIVVGRSEEEARLLLKGAGVSRIHCCLVRERASRGGMSQWRIVDQDSTEGVFIADRQIAERLLADADIIRIGEYELRFEHLVDHAHAAPAPTPKRKPKQQDDIPLAAVVMGETCVSCRQQLPMGAKLCVDCGVHPITGRPVLISHGRDEYALHEVADKWIRSVSWILWFTPLPIPIASDAYGRRRPWATWLIVLVTVVASVTFYFPARERKGWVHPGYDLMLWPEKGKAALSPELRWYEVEEILAELDTEEKAELERRKAELKGTVPNRLLDRKALQDMIAHRATPDMGQPAEFQPRQLLTHAFLHDTDSLLGLAIHLGSNMLFLLVFGSRVNALIGNILMLLLYPALAVASGLAQMYIGQPTGPALGASGAVMGMAGMYLVLFPVHDVYCAMWMRFFTTLEYTIFTARGFWLLAIYFGFDAIMVLLKMGGNVGHWAHMGGFLAGAAIALILLVSRIFDYGGGDLLSVTMGKHAWWLVGRPARWIKRRKKLAERTNA